MNTEEFRTASREMRDPAELKSLQQQMLLTLEMHEMLQEDVACLLHWMEQLFVEDKNYTLERIQAMSCATALENWDVTGWRTLENFRLALRRLVRVLEVMPPRPYDPIRGLLRDTHVRKEDAHQLPLFPELPQKREVTQLTGQEVSGQQEE